MKLISKSLVICILMLAIGNSYVSLTAGYSATPPEKHRTVQLNAHGDIISSSELTPYTLYLPMIGDDSYRTGVMISNLEDSEATITITKFRRVRFLLSQRKAL